MRRRVLAFTVLILGLAGSAHAQEYILNMLPIARGSSSAVSDFQLDATNDTVSFIFQCREPVTIDRLLVRYGSRTGTPPVFRISLQGVDGSGLPDGTIKDSGAANNVSVTFTPPADATWNGTLREFTPDQTYACTRGELLAIVIAHESGTIDGSNGSTFTTHVTNYLSGFPYAIRTNAGTPTKQTAVPVFGYRAGSATYGFPIEGYNITQYSSDSTPDERATRLVIPSTMCATAKLAGILVSLRGSDAGKTVLVRLYDTDNATVLQNVTIDSDHASPVATIDATLRIMFDEATLSTLTCGLPYLVSFLPQETASNFALREVVMDSVNDMSALPGGADCFAYSRTDGGAWTTSATTTRYAVDFILRDFVAPSGGGVKGIIGGSF